MDTVSSFAARFIFHQCRLYGWVPTTALMLKYRSGRLFALFYVLARKSNMWRSFVHQLFKHGVKDSPARLESRLTAPLKPASEKRYMICIHPHGVLCDGWHIVVAKNPSAFLPDNNNFCGVENFKPFLCFSPVIQYVPGHQELYRERCGGASAKDVQRVLQTTDCMPAVCPGGFAEAVYCWSDGKYEHSYLKGNKRFMAVAIKNQTDIIPTYTYGITSMYKTNTLFREKLSEVAQKTQIPLILFFGKFFGYPLHEEVVTVIYDPFPVSKYSMDDVDQALLDYQVYLRTCFDGDKGEFGMGDKEMLFVGPKPPKVRSKL